MISGCSFVSFPMREYICDTSIISSKWRGGKIDERACDKRVLPDHGDQIISTLCHPAAAIVSARFAIRCHFTFPKSTGKCVAFCVKERSVFVDVNGERVFPSIKKSMSS